MCRIARNDGTILSSSDGRRGAAASRYDRKNDGIMCCFNSVDLPTSFGRWADVWPRPHHGKLKCCQAFAERAARAFTTGIRRLFAALANEIGEASVIGGKENVIEFGDDVVRKKRCEVHYTQQRERR